MNGKVNGSVLRIVLGALVALVLACLGWVMQLSGGQAKASERIRANEVKVEVVGRGLDRIESKLDEVLKELRRSP